MKPNRWMTVEFHNSKNSVWNAIQEALQRSGFIIADVRTLDRDFCKRVKKKGYNAITYSEFVDMID